MGDAARFATDQAEFDRLAGAVRTRLDTEARLPAWPFKDDNGFVHVVEYDRLVGGDFAAVLQALALTYGDNTVTVAVVEPDLHYYRDRYALFPGFQVDGGLLEPGYADGLWVERGRNGTVALEYSADVIAVVGSSNTWSIWGQRDWEIALLHTPDDAGPWLHTPVPVFGRDLDLDSIRSPVGWGMPLSEEDLGTFWRSVQTRGSGE